MTSPGREGETDVYGKELILDLHDCAPATFTRESIEAYLETLCYLIGMEPCDLHFWDDVGVPEPERQTDPRTTGTSAVQFIITSNITIHTLDKIGKVFVNLFSCKDFDGDKATAFTRDWFGGRVAQQREVDRL